jgi:DNA-binding SARP family transcriptional activator
MALDPNEAGKRALIAYRQLSEIVKSDIGVTSAKTYLESYNQILGTLVSCFTIDPAFTDAVKHLRKLGGSLDHLSNQMESDGKVLLATARAFIELYLSPEDKKKAAIGFDAS